MKAIQAITISSYVLTLQQPWAWLVVMGLKDCENRRWFSRFVGRVLIHSSKALPRDYSEIAKCIYRDHKIRVPSTLDMLNLSCGAVIGWADFKQQVANKWEAPEPLKWWTGPYAWPIGQTHRFKNPAPLVGRQRLFKTPESLMIIE